MIRVLLSFVALLLVAFSWGNGDQPDRKISPGDKIKLICVEEPSLSKNYTVTADGLMLIDFLGAVQVSGLTIRDAAAKLSTKLVNDRILRKATLTMEFLNEPAPENRKIKVVGAVKKKEPIPWVAGMRLADVIRIAIAENNADLTKVLLVRQDGAQTSVDFSRFSPSNNANNPEVMPGDEVRVPAKSGIVIPPVNPDPPIKPNPNPGQNPGTGVGGAQVPGFIMVLGGVSKPGTYAMRSGLTLAGAIELAGGYSMRGDKTQVRLERKNSLPQRFDLATEKGDYALVPGDQVTVEVSSQRRFIQVSGAVRNPGLVEFQDGMTLTQAVMGAGGVLPSAKATDVNVASVGDTKGRKINYDDIVRGYRGDLALKAGDTIFVGGGKLSQPAPTPAPSANNGGGSTSSKKKAGDVAIVAVAVGLLLWLIGR